MKKKLGLSLIGICFIIIAIGIIIYRIVYMPNVKIPTQSTYVYIPSTAKYQDLTNLLYDKQIIGSKKTFEWVANKMNLPNNINPGRYLIKDKMNNRELVAMLRSGDQAPINISFNNIRTKKEFITEISSNLEMNSDSLYALLNNESFLIEYGYTPENVMAIFIPNTYEFNWNTSSKEFFARMYKEFNIFWNKERRQKVINMSMSPVEIVILASIVQQETKKVDEMNRVAGVYINRLNRNWPLQADPTVIFALNDFSIKRVLNKHKKVNSKYNTYKYRGLPPGPICLPDIQAIDQTLNYEKHRYFFFCAKEDFSGYHNFARSNWQHNINAKKYHNALNRLKIMK